jgi:3,4-dihydroxy 2-butanone 4-phosphate synthase
MTMDATTGLDEAIEAFEGGEHVLVHDFDDRESETDMIYPAAAVSPFDVARLRNEAGGWSAWPSRTPSQISSTSPSCTT